MSYYQRLSWINEYIKNVAPFIYVREEDSLLIKIPNEAYKINAPGIKILKHLMQGANVYSIVDNYADREAVARDLHTFFCDVRALLKGCYHEQDHRLAVEKISFTLPFNTLPVLSEIALTYRCNLSCRFCYASCGCTKKENTPELQTNSFKKIISIIKQEAEIPSVSFTGGEPLLREDLPELIRYAKKQSMWVNIITNGTLLSKEMVLTLKKAGLDSAQISLEAGTAEQHDHIVGKKGAFAATLSGFRHLKEAGIRVHTNTTISGLNKDKLPSILDLLKELGADKFSMNMLMPQGAALHNLNELLVTYSEIGGMALDLNAYAKKIGLVFMWYSPTPVCIFNPIVHGLGNKGCAACDGLLSVSPNGDILPCSSYPKTMGNLLQMKGKFRKTWRNSDFAYFQEKKFAHEKCKKCEHLAICNGGCPLYWNAVGYQELIGWEAIA